MDFGCSVSELAPLVVAQVPSRVRNQWLVAEALPNQSWTRDIQGCLLMVGLFEFFHLVDVLVEFTLPQEDVHMWRLDISGQYTMKSAYYQKSWAPAKCKIFLWLAVRNRCWTVDRLAKRNLSYSNLCLFCDQEEQDIQHILTTCVFAREFWFRILAPFGLQACTPSQQEFSFAEWWRKSGNRVQKDRRKCYNSLVVMGAWLHWKHCNSCVFEGVNPCIGDLICTMRH